MMHLWRSEIPIWVFGMLPVICNTKIQPWNSQYWMFSQKVLCTNALHKYWKLSVSSEICKKNIIAGCRDYLIWVLQWHMDNCNLFILKWQFIEKHRSWLWQHYTSTPWTFLFIFHLALYFYTYDLHDPLLIFFLPDPLL